MRNPHSPSPLTTFRNAFTAAFAVPQASDTHGSMASATLERSAAARMQRISDAFLRRFVDIWILVVAISSVVLHWRQTAMQMAGGLLPVLIGLATRGLLMSGRARAARCVFVVGLCTIVWSLPWFVNGIRSPVFLTSTLMVILSAWLLGRRAMWSIGLITLLVALAYTVAENQGWFTSPAARRTATDYVLVLAEALLLSLVAMHAMLKNYESSLLQEVKLQNDLKVAKMRMRQMLAGLHDGVLLVNDDLSIEYLNQRVCELFRLDETPAALSRGSAADFFARIAPQFANPEETLARLRTMKADGILVKDAEVALRDGRTIACNFTPLDYNNGHAGRVWHLRDVSTQVDTQRSLEQANQELQALSLTDALTGLANRRAFDQRLSQEWSRAQRNGSSVALLLMDVDWFKRFNDGYGHQAGDDCLRQVAALLNQHVRRSSELAARFGGEEFAVIIGEASLLEAWALAETLCTALRESGLVHAYSPLGRLSISVGVAALLPERQHDAALLLSAADSALYQAKDSGRDRAVAMGTSVDIEP